MFYHACMNDDKVIGYPDCSSLYADDVEFSYVIDMQVMLFLNL